MLFVRPNVPGRAVKRENGDRGEAGVEKGLEIDALEERSHRRVDRQVGRFPSMRRGKIVRISRLDDAHRVDPLRRNFGSDLSAQKDLGLEIRHEFIRAQRVIVADEVRAERRDCEDAGGDQRHEEILAWKGSGNFLDRSGVISPSKKKKGRGDAKHGDQGKAENFITGENDVERAVGAARIRATSKGAAEPPRQSDSAQRQATENEENPARANRRCMHVGRRNPFF